MAIFSILFLKLVPLYVTIALGFAAKRYLHAERDSLSRILIYIVVPFVFFNGAMNTPLSPSLLYMPLVIALISSCLCLLFYRIGRHYWQDSTANLLALTSGNANTGYFGLPVAMMLFDPEGVGVYLVLSLGVLIYESTVGFFMTARGQHTAGEALAKLLRLPSLYAFALGVALHAMGFAVPAFSVDFFNAMRGAYTIIGMMIIGMGLAGVGLRHIDWRFINLALLAKFICYPLVVWLLVRLDMSVIHLLDDRWRKAFLIISLMPLAANTVVYATLLKAQPEKAASSVFLSTLIAIVYVPLMAAWWVNG